LYENSEDVPTDILCKRLETLSDAVTKGKEGINREFYMSIPSRLDHDADLVILEASNRIKYIQSENAKLKALNKEMLNALQVILTETY